MTNPQTFLLSLTTIIGLIVLVALHDVTSAVAIPSIVGLTGVHIGIGANGTSGTGNKSNA